MRFFNRKTELGLNVLQLMYAGKRQRLTWTLGDIAAHLKESELYLHAILLELRKAGYVYSQRGSTGGYTLTPHTPEASLKEYLEKFNRQYTPSSILNTEAASEYMNQLVTKFFYNTKLHNLFEGRKPNVLPMFGRPDPDAPGAA